MNGEALNKLFLLYNKYVPNSKPDVNSQMCLLWSTKNPPDVLENTKQLEAIEKEFEIGIDEVEAVELYDSRFQFERIGYFCLDSIESVNDKLVFNRTVTLRDTWAK